MGGAEPLTVTAVTLRIKPKVYARVDDDATIVLTYPSAQAILEPSWNWTYGRKDMEVYGTVGTVHALDGKTMRVRTGTNGEERTVTPDPLVAPVDEPFDYLAAVVRGDVRVADGDLGSLPTNVTVMRILDAARQSARTGRTVRLRPARSPRAR